MTQVPVETIAEAFSRTAEKYDALSQDHPHLTRMRRKVYTHLMRYLSKSARILELNAGTGIDAIELAQRGFSVHATDIAPGMLHRLREKVDRLGLHDRVTLEQRSFLSLENVGGASFDAIFSNLGGLNCIPDLTPVIRQLPSLLNPGGVVTWVLMPHICLWEMAEVFRGNISVALRRFARGSVRARLEGLSFDVYYYSPQQATQCFGQDFELLGLEGLSVITPTGQSKNFAKTYPRLYHALSWVDDRLSAHWPWYGWGDFYILTMRYRGTDREFANPS